ncbi:MAG: tRNA (adenosine(37)-N6)-dimethylallyltransferase MiaA [Chloroflexi bacterium]|nr:tRNA (adenosine(37)-N6)-dimethylallyltransferase MiaA [Chloroflexota bacterium]
MRLVAIVGPTAAGKTRLAIELARVLDGEIVNADSRQVYRHMDIGTAKPDAAERAAVLHHLLDVVDPDEAFSLAIYRQKALEAISSIAGRGKVPFLVGGTGQYVWAILEGWTVPPVAPNTDLRRALEAEAAKGGHMALHRRLVQEDPVAAGTIDPRNVRRVVRALEVTRSTGVPFSSLRQKNRPFFDTLIIGLTMPRPDLYSKIDQRVDSMLCRGLVDEVRCLHAMGYCFDLAPMTGIGYKEISSYLAGEIDLESATEKMKFRTHHLARRQYAWFGMDDARIHWLMSDENAVEKAVALVQEYLGENNGLR